MKKQKILKESTCESQIEGLKDFFVNNQTLEIEVAL